MQLLNATRMQAGYTLGLQPDGRELLVVAVKGTFAFPARAGDAATLAPEQAPLVDADVFTGEPGFSAPLYECDWAARKPRCDVLLNGSAYAPGGRPAEQVRVGLRVGTVAKAFDVVGNRVWQVDFGLIVPSRPVPFTVMPLSYDNAFGGVDRSHPDEREHRWYEANHAGRGFRHNLDPAAVDGTPLPNTEEVGVPVASPRGGYRPMGFGAVGRAWQPRPRFAGTYDQQWLDDVCPLLPSDFDERYYQAAPADQQTAYLTGGEAVELYNLTPEGRTTFRLPTLHVPVTFYPRDGEPRVVAAALDTVVLEPDLQRVLLVWRASVPLRRNVFEIAQVIAGAMPRAWHRARERGKRFYVSLGALAAERRRERTDQGESDDGDVAVVDVDATAPEDV